MGKLEEDPKKRVQKARINQEEGGEY